MKMASALAALFALGLLGRCDSFTIPPHMKFIWDSMAGEGVIELEANPSLRINAKGGELKAGDPLVLWPCTPGPNEIWEFWNGLIRLKANPNLCLNAHGGTVKGTKIITWPCQHDGETVEHENFVMGEDGRLRLKNTDMCINIKESTIDNGGEAILWPCTDSEEETNDVFTYDGEILALKDHPEFRLNVKGGNTTHAPQDIVLWSCQPGTHEYFEMTAPEQRIRLHGRHDLCINAEGGLAAGSRLILWPCVMKEWAKENEQFKYDPYLNVMRSVQQPNLAFNVKGGGMGVGDEIILWPILDDEL